MPAGGGPHLQAQRGDRRAVAVAHRQRRQQLVAQVGLVGQFDAVGLGRVAGQVQVAPVQRHQGVAVAGAGDGRAGAVQQRPGQHRQRGVFMGEEPPGPLRGGERAGQRRLGVQAGGDPVGGGEVTGHQPLVTFGQPKVRAGESGDTFRIYRTPGGSKLCRYQWEYLQTVSRHHFPPATGGSLAGRHPA